MFNGNFKLNVYNRTLGLSPQTSSSSSLPISMCCAPIHLPSQATVWPESWPPLIWTSWMTFYMDFLLLSCSDPFSAYMAVKETSPPALKPFSGWFPCELGRKPQSLKGLTGSAWPQAMPASSSSFHVTCMFTGHISPTVLRVPQNPPRCSVLFPLPCTPVPRLFSWWILYPETLDPSLGSQDKEPFDWRGFPEPQNPDEYFLLSSFRAACACP